MESVFESNRKTIDGETATAVLNYDVPTELNPAPVHEMFEAMLSGWAFDWLHLLSRGLDQPTCVGREITADAEIIVDEEMVLDERTEMNLVNHIRQAQNGNGERYQRFGR